MKPLVFAAALALCAAGPAVAQTPAPQPPVSPQAAPTSLPAVSPSAAGTPGDVATIVDSGSTNTAGYTITVARDGNSSASSNAQPPAAGTISTTLARKLYADLVAASPLENLPRGACMKSSSFGTSIVILWHGSRTPDLTCPQNDLENALQTDVTAIAEALSVGVAPRRSGGPIIPGH